MFNRILRNQRIILRNQQSIEFSINLNMGILMMGTIWNTLSIWNNPNY